MSLCAQLTDALAQAAEKGRHRAATRYKEMAARLREEHEADKKRAKEALKKAKQKEEAAEAKAKKEETRAKRAEADAARKKTALEIEVNRLKATIEEIAARRGSSPSGSDSGFGRDLIQPRPRPTPSPRRRCGGDRGGGLHPPLLHASTAPWSAPGVEQVEDAVPALDNPATPGAGDEPVAGRLPTHRGADRGGRARQASPTRRWLSSRSVWTSTSVTWTRREHAGCRMSVRIRDPAKNAAEHLKSSRLRRWRTRLR